MNEARTYQVLQAAIDCGVQEFVVCPGSRNSSFVEALRLEENVITYYWPEERSASFFALGLSKRHERPVAIIITSGTAAGELLPAAMEAYYSGIPLLLITADRPHTFRGSGAPQSAEQVGLFGRYASFALDVNGEVECDLSKWLQQGPAHLNVCLEEPQGQPKFQGRHLAIPKKIASKDYEQKKALNSWDRFISQAERPLVIIGGLREGVQEQVVDFLLKLDAPILLEGMSGLRGDPRLDHLRLYKTTNIFRSAKEAGYEIDSILRIGSVPTHRVWRDLEYRKDDLKVCALSELPFSGLSWNRWVACAPLDKLLTWIPIKNFSDIRSKKWLQQERHFEQMLIELFQAEPLAEPSMVHHLSKLIHPNAHVFLGNSLPIREWDMAAVNEHFSSISASRGLNGIDGQISTFLGMCRPNQENWAIIGDLTAIYDLAGYWILPQLHHIATTTVIINNGGGKIFDRMFPIKELQNEHQLSFEPLANMWGLNYEKWHSIPASLAKKSSHRLIEIIPDPEATKRFWKKYDSLKELEIIPVLAG